MGLFILEVLNQHKNGIGAKYTARRLPVKLLFFEEFTTVAEAFYKEKQIQGWSRKKKWTLINNKLEDLSKLAECKNESHFSNKKGFDSAQPPNEII